MTDLTVTCRASGVDLDVTSFVRHLLTDLIGLLDDPDSDLMDDLDRVLNTTPPDPFLPERELSTEALVERLIGALNPASLAIRVHGPELRELVTDLAVAALQQRPTGVAA